MNPTTCRCLPHTAGPNSRSEEVWASYERRINYSAPFVVVFMPIHISCSSAQNNVKPRSADVGNWWDRQQTPRQPPSTSLLDRYRLEVANLRCIDCLYRRFDVLTYLLFSWKIITNCHIQKIILDGLSALHNATNSIYRRYNNIRRVGGGCFLLVDVNY